MRGEGSARSVHMKALSCHLHSRKYKKRYGLIVRSLILCQCGEQKQQICSDLHPPSHADHKQLFCNLSLSGVKLTATACSLAHWCNHCGCSSCPTPSSSALCRPCAAGCCGHGGLVMKTVSHAPGGAHEPCDAPGHALCDHRRRCQ